MQQLIDGLVSTMEVLGYPGIAVLMFLEVVFPPIPSELIMPFGGFTAAKGELNLFGVVLAGSIGSMLGALVFYYLGKFLGTERLVKFANKYGRWLTVSGKDVQRADGWFDKYGYIVVFFCRFVPGIRSLVSLPAGVAGMKMAPFLLLTFIGNVIWNFILTYAGYTLGDNYALVDSYIGGWGKYVLIALAGILAIWYIVRLVQQMREKPEEEQGEQGGASQQQVHYSQSQPQQARMQQPPSWGQQPSVPPSFSADMTIAEQQVPQQPWHPQGYQPTGEDKDATIIRRPGQAPMQPPQPEGGQQPPQYGWTPPSRPQWRQFQQAQQPPWRQPQQAQNQPMQDWEQQQRGQQ